MGTLETHLLPKEVQKRKNFDLRAGDTVKVHLKIEEKGKTRTQIFEGTVIARKHGRENGATFTVRKIASGVGVERIFPLYSPLIEKIEIIRRSRMRRSKLYFLRNKVSRKIRYKMRRIFDHFASTVDLPELEEETPAVVEEEVKAEETTKAEEATAEQAAEATEAEAAEEAPAEEPK